MKKILVLSLLWICSLSVSVQAQDIKSILSGIAKNVVGDKLTTEFSVIGTWAYKSPACKLENDDANILSSAGGSVMATTVEGSLTKVYDKLGFDKCIFTFAEDGTYTTAMGKIKGKGTYTFNSEDKTITFKTRLGVKFTAKVSVTGSSMALTFKADKLLTAIKAITGIAGNITQYAGVLSSLADKYDGLSLGFELAKH